MQSTDAIRIAAVADLHYARASQGMLQPLFAQITERADILVLPGDLTEYGLAEEAKVLARDLTAAVKIPVVAVLGNHDFESNQAAEIARILAEAGVHVLDGDAVQIHGVGFAGVKGFARGFGRGTLGSWGEPAIKQFVQEAVNEALKLESARARLKTAHRVAVLHYSPIQGTVEGEPIEIYPWLGSSRLEEPLTRFRSDRRRPRPRASRRTGRKDLDRHSGLQRRHQRTARELPRSASVPNHRGAEGIDRRHLGRSTSHRTPLNRPGAASDESG